MSAEILSLHQAEPQHIPAPDPQRRILILAMVALIREQFRNSPLVAGDEARALLTALSTAGMATVRAEGEVTSLDLMGIRARTTGSAHALLSEWIRAAHQRIKGVA